MKTYYIGYLLKENNLNSLLDKGEVFDVSFEEIEQEVIYDKSRCIFRREHCDTLQDI